MPNVHTRTKKGKLMPFNEKQIRQMLKPVNPRRVLKDGKGNSHLPAHDVIAHLNRVFGFGGWDTEVVSLEQLFEEPGTKSGRWNACYKAIVKLSVKDEHGAVVATYEDGSTGDAQNQGRADAHDLAMKSAISLALKRAAKNLGDGWGLSLYDKGRMTAVVKDTLVGLPDKQVEDVQQNVEQVTSMGHDEIDREPSPADVAREDLRELCRTKHWNMKTVADLYLTGQDKEPKIPLGEASADDVRAYMSLLESGAVTVS